MDKQLKKQRNIQTTIVVIAGVLRVLLQMGLPIIVDISAANDDMLYIRYADSLLDGNWLGKYNVYTLNKVPAFGMFLAFARYFNIPYMMAVGSIYTLACVLFYRAMCLITSSNKALLCYLYLLFSPVMLSSFVGQKMYRVSIVPTLVLCIVSCYFIIYEINSKAEVCKLRWYFLAGVFYTFFGLTREDSVWMLLFIFGASVLIVCINMANRKKLKREMFFKNIIYLLLPFLIWFVGANGIKTINYMNYGIFTLTDFKDTHYAAVGKKLLSVDAEKKNHVWVTRNTIEKLYQISPGFSLLQPQLDRIYQSWNNGTGENEGEIEKDYIIWAIRWAADVEGVYTDAVSADKFWEQIDNEMQAAFDSGELKKNNALILSNLAHPIYISEIPQILKSVYENFIVIAKYDGFEASVPKALNISNNIDYIQSVVNSNIIVSSESYYEFQGWAFSTEEEKLKLHLTINGVESLVDCTQSQDVYDYYVGKGIVREQAASCRFDVILDKEEYMTANLKVTIGENILYDGPLQEYTPIADDRICQNITKNSQIDTDTKCSERFGKTVILANHIVNIYKIIGTILIVLSFVSFLGETIIKIYRFFRHKHKEVDWGIWFVKLGLLLTILSDLLIVSINYYDAFNRLGAYRQYTSGVHPILQIFICLSTIWICDKTRHYIKRRTKTNEVNYSDTML